MTFNQFLHSKVCYRRLIQSMPEIGSLYQLKLVRLYEAGKLPTSHCFARQMHKLEYLTNWFRIQYETGCSCEPLQCYFCLENGGF